MRYREWAIRNARDFPEGRTNVDMYGGYPPSRCGNYGLMLDYEEFYEMWNEVPEELPISEHRRNYLRRTRPALGNLNVGAMMNTESLRPFYVRMVRVDRTWYHTRDNIRIIYAPDSFIANREGNKLAKNWQILVDVDLPRNARLKEFLEKSLDEHPKWGYYWEKDLKELERRESLVKDYLDNEQQEGVRALDFKSHFKSKTKPTKSIIVRGK